MILQSSIVVQCSLAATAPLPHTMCDVSGKRRGLCNCWLQNREVMNKRIGDLAKNLNKSNAMESRSGASDVGNSYIIGELY